MLALIIQKNTFVMLEHHHHMWWWQFPIVNNFYRLHTSTERERGYKNFTTYTHYTVWQMLVWRNLENLMLYMYVLYLIDCVVVLYASHRWKLILFSASDSATFTQTALCMWSTIHTLHYYHYYLSKLLWQFNEPFQRQTKPIYFAI